MIMPLTVKFDSESCDKSKKLLTELEERFDDGEFNDSFAYLHAFFDAAKETIQSKVTLFEGKRENYELLHPDGDTLFSGDLAECLEKRPKTVGVTINRSSGDKHGPPEYRWDGNAWVYSP